MTRTLSIGKDRLLESSLSTFDGRSAPASRKTAARPTCRRAVSCPRVPQLVRPAPRLFRRGGGRQSRNRACRSPGAHRERRAPVARSRARDLPGRRRAIPRGRRRPPNRPVLAARPESGCATLAHCSLLIAHCSSDAGHLGRQRGGLLRVPADAGQHARHLGGRGGVGLAGHQASGDQPPATLEEPSRAGPRVLADREGHRRPAPLAARRVAPREDPGTLDERLAHERAAVPRDAAQPPALGARALRGREAEVGRDLSPGREAGEVPHLGGEGERRGEAPRPSRARARRRAAPGRRPWRSPRPWPPARRRRPRPTRRPRGPRGSPPATRRLPGRRGAASPGGAGTGASRARRSACARPTTCRAGTGSRPRAGAPPRGRRPGRPSPGPARAAPRPARGAPRPGRPPRPGRATHGPPRRACRSSWSASRPSWEASGRPRAPPACRHASASAPARIRAAALARAVGRLREVGHPLGHLAVVVSPGRASPRLAVLGRRRAYRRGSQVAADSEACTIDGHGDPPVGRGASAPFCRNGTILAHGRSPGAPTRNKLRSLSSGHIV